MFQQNFHYDFIRTQYFWLWGINYYEINRWYLIHFTSHAYKHKNTHTNKHKYQYTHTHTNLWHSGFCFCFCFCAINIVFFFSIGKFVILRMNFHLSEIFFLCFSLFFLFFLRWKFIMINITPSSFNIIPFHNEWLLVPTVTYGLRAITFYF